MARIVRRKKVRRNLALIRFTSSFFIISLFLYLLSSLFLRVYNNDLSAKTQTLNAQIAAMENQNENVAADIQGLGSSDRIDEIAATAGMVRNQDNIVTISNTGE